MFNEDDEIMTPKGLGYFIEEYNGTAYVELDNGVEMDFPIDDIETKEVGLARIQKEREANLAKYYKPVEENTGPTFVQQLAMAEALFDSLPLDAQAAISRMAHNHLLERCKEIVAEHNE